MPPELEVDDEYGDDEDDGVVGGFDGVSSDTDDSSAEESMSMGTAELGVSDDDGIVASFDGVEDETDDSDDTGQNSSGGGSSSDTGDTSIQSAIEGGLAEAAAVGLEGQERTRVSSEMRAVAEKFKVGYFGEKCVQKYLKRDLEDIPPEYGLAAALIAFAALAIHKRPDGEDALNNAVSIVRERLSGDDEADAPPQPRAPREPRREQRGAPPEPEPAPQEESRGEPRESSEQTADQPQQQPQPQPAGDPQ